MQKILKKWHGYCHTHLFAAILFLMLIGNTLSGQTTGRLKIDTPVFDDATGITSCDINWVNDGSNFVPAAATAVNITAFITGTAVCLIPEGPIDSTEIHTGFPSAASPTLGYSRIFTSSSVQLRRFGGPFPLPTAPYAPLIKLRFRAQAGESYTITVTGALNLSPPLTISSTDTVSATYPGFDIIGNIVKPINIYKESCDDLGDAIPNVTVTKTVMPLPGLSDCFSGDANISQFFPFGYYEFKKPLDPMETNTENLYHTNYRVRPSKTNSTEPCCGIDFIDYDLWDSLVNPWLLGMDSLLTITNARYLAADASGDGIVSTFDKVFIALCILGRTPSGPAEAWRFAPFASASPTAIYPGLGAVIPDHLDIIGDPVNGITPPSIQHSFWGVKRGDMNGSCEECGASLRPKITENRDVVFSGATKTLSTPDLELLAGQESLIPVFSSAISNAGDILLELMIDPLSFDIISLENGDLSDEYGSLGMLAKHNAIALQYNWITNEKEGVNIPDGTVLFFARVRAKKDIQSIQNAIWLRSDAVNVILNRKSREKMKYEFKVGVQSENVFFAKIAGSNILTESARVLVTVPKSSLVRFTVLDSHGHQYSTFSREMLQGVTDVAIPDLPKGTGLYTILIQSSFGQKQLKLVKI